MQNMYISFFFFLLAAEALDFDGFFVPVRLFATSPGSFLTLLVISVIEISWWKLHGTNNKKTNLNPSVTMMTKSASRSELNIDQQHLPGQPF